MDRQPIHVGHSPDPDDAFMFYALAHDKIDTGPYQFIHQLEDIETLNQRALRGELEVSAVSIHAYTQIAERYALLPSGCSMGDEYGPMLVAKEKFTRDDLPKLRLAIPGKLTTAYLALQLYCPEPLQISIVPFDQILPALVAGDFDAGLIIHEGQLTFGQMGLVCMIDLGVWWFEDTSLPLPLGGNVVRKDLGLENMREISRLLKESIQYSLDHREEALTYALQFARDMPRELADQFVGMYVNEWTLDYGPRGREAIRTLLQRGQQAGIVQGTIEPEFVE